jgi:hypothetical protein
MAFGQRVELVLRHLAEICDRLAFSMWWTCRSDAKATFASSFSTLSLSIAARSAAAPVISCTGPATATNSGQNSSGARSGHRGDHDGGREWIDPVGVASPVAPYQRRLRISSELAGDRETVLVTGGPDLRHSSQPLKIGQNPSLPP